MWYELVGVLSLSPGTQELGSSFLNVWITHKSLWFSMFEMCYIDDSGLFSVSGHRIVADVERVSEKFQEL